MARPVYRLGQFVAHLRARVIPEEEAFVRRVLPATAVALFERMPVPDRRHALDVAERLLKAGHTDPELLSAALLHDVAKGHRVRLWHRVAGVLLEAMAPRALARLASPRQASWRYAFHLYLHHTALSAEQARAAGCSDRCAAFIRGISPEMSLQSALLAADEAS